MNHICICVKTCTCMYICKHVYIYVCHAYMYVQTWIHVYSQSVIVKFITIPSQMTLVGCMIIMLTYVCVYIVDYVTSTNYISHTYVCKYLSPSIIFASKPSIIESASGYNHTHKYANIYIIIRYISMFHLYICVYIYIYIICTCRWLNMYA
jgi:hypothetical protein